jgi:glycosyltransferase involved in cell wall biosynthesis
MSDIISNGRHNLRIIEIITSHGAIGGEEKNFVTSIRKLRELGDEITVVYPQDSPNADYFKSEKLPSAEWKCLGKADLTSVYKLVKLIKEKRADIIHANSETSAIIAGMAASICKIPLVSTVSNFSSPGSYSKSNTIICASQAIRRYLLDYGLNNDKLKVIFNGIDLKRYPIISAVDARVVLKMVSDVKIVGLFATQINEESGINTTLYAWPDINGIFLGAKLIIVGTDSNAKLHSEEIERLGIQSSVEFKGQTNDFRTLMGACDVIIIPSRKDAMSIIAIEAMALGKVVVASNTGGLKEIIEDEQTGILVDQNDLDGFAQTTATLLAESERAVNMGNAGRLRVEALFNADIQIRKVRNVLESEVVKNQEKKKNK